MKRDIDIRKDLITPDVAASLIPAFAAAYGMAVSVADSIDFLGGWELREQIIPHLKNWAVEYELHRRAIAGTIPFECTVVPNIRKNHNHIELRKNGFVLTVSQTHSIRSMPRECIFRNDRCMDGQLALSGFESRDHDGSKEIYAILTHGRGLVSPAFILCGIPNPNMSSWAKHEDLYQITNGITVIDTSPIDDDIVLDYREQVKEHARLIQ